MVTCTAAADITAPGAPEDLALSTKIIWGWAVGTAGSATTSYAHAGGPLELDKAGTTYWYLPDTLGSVRLVTDSAGASPATYAYSAFGSTRKSSGSLSNEVRFTGERTDGESGLEFLRARTYDPSVGTFLQRDSWGISATDSQSIDGYAYTANNPVNAVDPSGHQHIVYDDGTGGNGILVASTSAYTAPIKSMSAAQRGDVLSGASETATLRKAMRKANPAPQASNGCGFGPACVLTNAIGTAGDLARQGVDTLNKDWQASGGAAVDHDP